MCVPMAANSSDSSVTLSMGKVSYWRIPCASAIFLWLPGLQWAFNVSVTRASRDRNKGILCCGRSSDSEKPTRTDMTPMRHKTKWTALLVCSLALGAAVTHADSSQALLLLLVKKGLITQDEANQLQQEAAQEAAAAPQAAPATTTTTTTSTTQPMATGPGNSGAPGYSGAASAGVG